MLIITLISFYSKQQSVDSFASINYTLISSINISSYNMPMLFYLPIGIFFLNSSFISIGHEVILTTILVACFIIPVLVWKYFILICCLSFFNFFDMIMKEAVCYQLMGTILLVIFLYHQLLKLSSSFS